VKPMLLAIGSSTGGPAALVSFVQELRARLDGPLPVPGVLTQHMPPTFTPLLAEQLTRVGGIRCVEATAGVVLVPGTLYLAPGGRHLLVDRRGGDLVAKLDDGPAENFCKPAVDPMLRSATVSCEGRVLLVMLTGMGQDGLLGTRAVVEAGGAALAQDEASSIVWGMPGAIARAGLCQAVLPIPALAERASRILRGRL
jgi:two-component system, chemotaxis family, protein-glutamate methylesterase/glutaminase